MRNFWYIAATSKSVKRKPFASKILDEPILLFRDNNLKVTALFDRCPHRNVHLSNGKVINNRIQCPYHGWEFNTQGQCEYIPSSCQGESIPGNAKTKVYPTIEKQGYIWVWIGDREPQADETPFDLPFYGSNKWKHITFETTINNSVENVIENFIDCPHTGYVHGGLFRNPANHFASTLIKTFENGITIEIDEENQANSILSKLLTTTGHEVSHQDKFILPSTTQVSYGFGPKKQIIGCQISIPIEDFKTKVYVYVTWQLGLISKFIKPIVPLIGKVVMKQDLVILEEQGQIIQQLGQNFTSAPADTANLWIKVCRQKASRGEKETNSRSKKVKFKL